MAAAKALEPRNAIGRSIDSLTLAERLAFAGQYVAFEIYTPKTLPFRIIEAIGDSLKSCVRILRERGRDPRQFEFQRLAPPY